MKEKIIGSSIAMQRELVQGSSAPELPPWEKKDLIQKEKLIGNMKKISEGLERNLKALDFDNAGLFREFIQDEAGTRDRVNDLISERSATNKVDKKIRLLLNDYSKPNKLFSSEFVPERMVFKYMYELSNRSGMTKQREIAGEALSQVMDGKTGLEAGMSYRSKVNLKLTQEKYISSILLNRPNFEGTMRSRDRFQPGSTSRSNINSSNHLMNIQSMSTDQSTDQLTSTKKRLFTITKNHGFSTSPPLKNSSPRLVKKIKIK